MKPSLILSILAVLILACKEDGGFGHYYEFDYSDSLFSVVTSDTVHIVWMPLVTFQNYDSNVPFDVVHDSSIADSVKLNFTISYGGYSSAPNPWTQDTIKNDTLFIWYAYIQPAHGFPKQSGTHSIVGIQTSPKGTFHILKSMQIRIAPEKHVTFQLKSASW